MGEGYHKEWGLHVRRPTVSREQSRERLSEENVLRWVGIRLSSLDC